MQVDQLDLLAEWDADTQMPRLAADGRQASARTLSGHCLALSGGQPPISPSPLSLNKSLSFVHCHIRILQLLSVCCPLLCWGYGPPPPDLPLEIWTSDTRSLSLSLDRPLVDPSLEMWTVRQ